MSRGVKGARALAVALALCSTAGVAGNSVDEPRRPDGSTPLHWAVFEADIPEAARLIKAGADVDAANSYGINTMLLAADIANTELIQMLLKAGASATSANHDNETALHLVARAGNVEAARLLLKAGARVDARDNLGQQTPLMWAVARRQPAMVEFLVSKGADINARSAIRDYLRVVTAESRAKQLDRGGFTPLMYAARENCRECAEILLKHKVDVNLPDPSGVSPLVIAMLNSNWDIAKRLVESGADVNQWDMFGTSPLAVAIGGMSGGGSRNPLDAESPNKATGAELVQMLIDRGANPNQQAYFRPGSGGRGGGAGGRGATPFMAAVSSGNLDLVKLLLAKGANPKLGTSEGQNTIILAVQARGGGGGGFGGGGGPDDDAPPGAEPGSPATAGARPGGAGPAGAPAGAAAGPARAGGPGAGGPPGGGGGARGRAGGPGGGGGAPGGGGGSSATQIELIKLMASLGADVNQMAQRHFLQRSRGGSAIHFAVRGGGNRQVIQTLVELGCDINAKDEDGLTALDYAMGRGYVPFLQMPQQPNKAVADFLRSLGANVELEKIPDWPPQGAPIATVVYDSVIWPVDPVGP